MVYRIILLSIIFSYSCSVQRPYLKLRTDKRQIIAGDSVKLSWETNEDFRIYIEGIDSAFHSKGFHYIKPEKSGYFKVQTKNEKTDYTRKVRIRVNKPDIHYFTVLLHPYEINKVLVQWEASDVKHVDLLGIRDSLPRTGSLTLDSLLYNEFKLVARSSEKYADTAVAYLDSLPEGTRPFIRSAKTVNTLIDSNRLTADFLTFDISNYPKEVKLKLIVIDSTGNYIHGLAPPYSSKKVAKKYFKKLYLKTEDKEIPVNFTVREIKNHDKARNDIALVMDYSGSVFHYKNVLLEAEDKFIDSLSENMALTVSRFDHRLYSTGYPLADRKKIKLLLDSGEYYLGGSTSIYAAGDFASRNLKWRDHNRTVVLFTDGHDNSSFNYFGEYAVNANEFVDRIRQRNINLYIVGFGNHINYQLLDKMAEQANGKFYFLHHAGQLINVFKEINYSLTNYYEISFKPKGKVEVDEVKLIYHNNKQDVVLETDYTPEKKSYLDENGELVRKPDEEHVYIPETRQILTNFEFNSAEIPEDYKETLKFYVDFLKKYKYIQVKLYGHSDLVGRDVNCQEISVQRVEKIYHYFVDNGIDPIRIQTHAQGKSDPRHPKEQYDWQAKENRRVEILMSRE